ncbi:hypothetical protein GOP47_0003322 [Adiantum capillus-veneris]|uniref:Uncharacterized protein n=1 Tax=Adiantum capillus-veneris TaxID=13818 RepID=A0A9D4VC09_ADICA|nr:hypothetical protein GOP47_0003322 [Adiantum capillus-veneris]
MQDTGAVRFMIWDLEGDVCRRLYLLGYVCRMWHLVGHSWNFSSTQCKVADARKDGALSGVVCGIVYGSLVQPSRYPRYDDFYEVFYDAMEARNRRHVEKGIEGCRARHSLVGRWPKLKGFFLKKKRLLVVWSPCRIRAREYSRQESRPYEWLPSIGHARGRPPRVAWIHEKGAWRDAIYSRPKGVADMWAIGWPGHHRRLKAAKSAGGWRFLKWAAVGMAIVTP